jgi:hypothetical protein
MAKQANGKVKILYVKEILERSAGRPISMRELLERLSERVVTAERKSVSDDIRLLRQYGLPVAVIRRGRFTVYSLKNTP